MLCFEISLEYTLYIIYPSRLCSIFLWGTEMNVQLKECRLEVTPNYVI